MVAVMLPNQVIGQKHSLLEAFKTLYCEASWQTVTALRYQFHARRRCLQTKVLSSQKARNSQRQT